MKWAGKANSYGAEQTKQSNLNESKLTKFQSDCFVLVIYAYWNNIIQVKSTCNDYILELFTI